MLSSIDKVKMEKLSHTSMSLISEIHNEISIKYNSVIVFVGKTDRSSNAHFLDKNHSKKIERYFTVYGQINFLIKNTENTDNLIDLSFQTNYYL